MPSVNGLVAAVAYPDQRVRNGAARVLTRTRDREAVPELVRALRHTEPSARRAVAEALGGIGEPAAISALVAALDDRAGSVRRAAARSLVRLGPAAGDESRAVLTGTSARARPHAAWALGRIGDLRSRPLFLRMLDDADPTHRRLAVWAVAKVPDEDVVAALREATADDDEQVRRTAAVLRRLAARAAPAGEESPDGRS
jgi:HEAT repeat protein